MAYAQSLIIMLLASQASIGAADGGERTILREPAAVIGQNHAGSHATKDARRISVIPLDRVAEAALCCTDQQLGEVSPRHLLS